MTETFPTPADLAALPPLTQPLPARCSCPWPTPGGCLVLRRNLARWWGEEEPEGEECGCGCHQEKETP